MESLLCPVKLEVHVDNFRHTLGKTTTNKHFPNISEINYPLRFREVRVNLQGKIYRKIFIESMIFSQKLTEIDSFAQYEAI